MVKPKICVAITASSNKKTLDTIRQLQSHSPYLLEFRLDYMNEKPDLKTIRESTNTKLIATYRRTDQGGVLECPEPERIKLLLEACDTGFNYLDLAITTPNLSKVIDEVHTRGAEVIVSYHDFEGTPSNENLQSILGEIMEKKADICKIIGTATSPRDNLTYLNIVHENPETRLVSFAMGKDGLMSRIFSPLHGAEYTYASAETGMESAPGQLTIVELIQIYRYMGAMC